MENVLREVEDFSEYTRKRKWKEQVPVVMGLCKMNVSERDCMIAASMVEAACLQRAAAMN